MDVSKAFGRRVPFASHVGIEVVEKGNGRAVLMLDVRPELTNSFEVAHGGAVMTLLDIAMALAARTLDPDAIGVITVEMKTTFIGAAIGRITAEGRCLHAGKTVAFCEGRVHGPDGKLVAAASGTFMLRHGSARKRAAAREAS
jgi:uncharacterized protein (TIGR00369 family)